MADENVLRVNSVAINFVTTEDVKMLREIEQFYNTEISEMVSSNADQDPQRKTTDLKTPSTQPLNVADLI